MRVLFDKQLHLNDSDEEEPPFLATMRMFWESFFLTKHFPILTTLAVRLPDSWAHKLVPGYAQFRMVNFSPLPHSGNFFALCSWLTLILYSASRRVDPGDRRQAQTRRLLDGGWP